MPSLPVLQPSTPREDRAWRSPWKKVQRWRLGVQVAFLLVTVLIGVEFTRFCWQALEGGPLTATRPGGIEAFLPIAALVGARRFFATGQWDDIHPAGLTFLLATLAGALFARRAFCSWVCPVGTISSALEWTRKKLRLPQRWGAPKWVRVLGVSPKYPLLAFFVVLISAMPLPQVQAFLYGEYNVAADAKMLLLWWRPTALVLGVTAALVLLSVVVRHAWCRSLCPYGAMLGVAGALSPFRIVRNLDACNDCGACTRACGMGLRVAEKKAVHSIECSSCLSCVAACNVKDALEVRTLWGARVRPWLVPACALAILLLAWGGARAFGGWESTLRPQVFAQAYRDTLATP